jgi:hypothetical protein
LIVVEQPLAQGRRYGADDRKASGIARMAEDGRQIWEKENGYNEDLPLR